MAARAYVLWMQPQGKRAVRREVSGGEAVERKGTAGVQEAGADDAVEETCSPTTRPVCGMTKRVDGRRRRWRVTALESPEVGIDNVGR